MWGRRLAAEAEAAVATETGSHRDGGVVDQISCFWRIRAIFNARRLLFLPSFFAAFCCASCRRFISSDAGSEVSIAIGDIENLQGISRSSHFAYVNVYGVCDFAKWGNS